MADLLKDMINATTVRKFGENLQKYYDAFPVNDFMDLVFDDGWGNLELLQRGKKVCEIMSRFLPTNYGEALAILDQAVVTGCEGGFLGFVFAHFIETHGLRDEDWQRSMTALELYTQYFSCEFAVRPFIIKDENRMMKQMLAWSKSENEDVRRFSSEGCRPALPWAIAIPSLKQDPTSILPILENLKADESLYVRKSVANNLNDISKTHPDLVAKIAKEWYGDDKNTNWIIKHGCRTLLKKGNQDVLEIFGFVNAKSIDFTGLITNKTTLAIGDDLLFDFAISAAKDTKVRLEYGVDFVKANGKRNRKIFQISETNLTANETKSYTKKHSFKDLSTRKHYPGLHTFTVIVNGAERGSFDVDLTKKSEIR